MLMDVTALQADQIQICLKEDSVIRKTNERKLLQIGTVVATNQALLSFYEY